MTRWRDDRGNAMVEFTFLGALLLVPLIYAVITALQVERAAYAVTAATREAGRVYVAEGAGAAASDDALAAARTAMADQGLDLEPGDLQIGCSADPCNTAGAMITVRIEASVPLPLVPSFGRTAPSVTVHGRHDEVIDCFADGTVAGPGGSACG
jgi:hypothetical protein